MAKILFILKRREDYSSATHGSHLGLSTGLFNSASFVCNMLNSANIESKLVVVTDNNDIDREVNQYKPTHCIIEAIWVIPSKFYILQKLHPTVKWIIRIHSEIPFMANEGIAMGWFGDYSLFDNIILSPNSPRMLSEIKMFLKIKNNWSDEQTNDHIVYLPNYYPQEYKPVKNIDKTTDVINIGCFGAIRPLKNQLLQAMVAIQFAEKQKKKLVFHVNAGRVEMKGEPILHNLHGLFEHVWSNGHRLISHTWSDRDTFLNLCATMDYGMQVSFSETFNIVAADFISQGVSVLGSKEIPWVFANRVEDPTNSEEMLSKLEKMNCFYKFNVISNRYFLNKYSDKTKKIWIDYINKGQ